MKNKYLNEAIIGNKNIIASFTKKGEMIRLFYPTRDYKQFIDEFVTGVKVNDSALIYLHDDINNVYNQYYTENTNILSTIIENRYFNLKVEQTDFVSIESDTLIKKYKFINNNSINLDVNFLAYSKIFSNYDNMSGSRIENNILRQYNHDYTISIFSKNEIQSYRLNNSKEDIKSGSICDKDYIGMANDSAISINVGNIRPNEEKEIILYIVINKNENKIDLEEIRKIDANKELKNVKKYWNEYVKKHDGLNLLNKDKSNEKLIYIRTILLYALLTNEETGGIIAAVEVDEKREKSGGYAYCWPRDAVFITKALDILKMEDISTKFYTKFCKDTQSENGMWEQRFYTDGRLAPCWGYQIDETASVVYGVYEHYKTIKDINFLKETYEMCQKAIKALAKFPLGTFPNGKSVPFENFPFRNVPNEKSVTFGNYNNEERFLTHESYDLWEMNEGIHLYSLSAIYAAFKAMIEIKRELNINDGIEEIENNAQNIKEYCLNNFYDKETKSLKRNNKDNITDISMIGSVVPFQIIGIDQEIIKNTIEKIDLSLRTYTGGYLRFENDNYMGGNNPWPIATLWMALYNLETNKIEEARKQIEFVTKTATTHGFLAEQVDNETMQSKWVIGLGWSHAMYIMVLSKLWMVSN